MFSTFQWGLATELKHTFVSVAQIVMSANTLQTTSRNLQPSHLELAPKLKKKVLHCQPLSCYLSQPRSLSYSLHFLFSTSPSLEFVQTYQHTHHATNTDCAQARDKRHNFSLPGGSATNGFFSAPTYKGVTPWMKRSCLVLFKWLLGTICPFYSTACFSFSPSPAVKA